MKELRESDGTHTHVTTRGCVAERTAFYMPEMVRVIGLALERATASARKRPCAVLAAGRDKVSRLLPVGSLV
eukprot:3687658-Heterocapsa_arctica.AAC.1